MTLTRRLFAALFSILLLQLTLLGSGTLCGMHGGGNRGMRAHDMGAMSAPSPARATADTAAHTALTDVAPMSPSPCGGSGAGNDCGLPWAPGQCSSTTSCTVTAAPVVAVVALASASRVAPALSEPAAIGSRAAPAPELPPPRA